MDARASEPQLRALMLAGLEGDAAAHRALLRSLTPRLRAYFKDRMLRAGRAVADAEDLVQETLMAIHTRRNTYDRTQLFTPWVYAIARYRLVDHLRRTKASAAAVPIEDEPGIFSEEDHADVESTIDVKRLLARLPAKTRAVIEHVKLEGLTASEAAVRSGATPSAVKVSVHRGLKALARFVSSDGKGS